MVPGIILESEASVVDLFFSSSFVGLRRAVPLSECDGVQKHLKHMFLAIQGAVNDEYDEGGVRRWVLDGGNVDAVVDGKTLLMGASALANEQLVRFLCDNGAAVDLQDASGATSLIMAAYAGHTEIVEHLLAVGARTDLVDASGLTALEQAQLRGHLAAASLLSAVPPASHDSLEASCDTNSAVGVSTVTVAVPADARAWAIAAKSASRAACINAGAACHAWRTPTMMSRHQDAHRGTNTLPQPSPGRHMRRSGPRECDLTCGRSLRHIEQVGRDAEHASHAVHALLDQSAACRLSSARARARRANCASNGLQLVRAMADHLRRIEQSLTMLSKMEQEIDVSSS